MGEGGLQRGAWLLGADCSVQVQTETHLWHKGGYSKDLNLEGDSVRLLQMYNDLQKRYLKEIKTNQEQREAIKNLTDFFEEIEDLKRAVQESVKLNYQYEKCLKQISIMYGLPFMAHL